MSVSELVSLLIEYPADMQVFIGKGIGPVARIQGEPTAERRIVVVLSPAGGKS